MQQLPATDVHLVVGVSLHLSPHLMPTCTYIKFAWSLASATPQVSLRRHPILLATPWPLPSRCLTALRRWLANSARPFREHLLQNAECLQNQAARHGRVRTMNGTAQPAPTLAASRRTSGTESFRAASTLRIRILTLATTASPSGCCHTRVLTRPALRCLRFRGTEVGQDAWRRENAGLR